MTDYIEKVEHREIVVDVPTAKRLLTMVEESLQRKLNIDTVNKYKRDILNGDWHNNGCVMRVSNTGKLIDGQHRCHAVVEAQKPIPCMVILITNISEDAIHKIDRGKSRTTKDVFKLKGYRGSSSKAGEVARCKIKLMGRNPTDDEVIKFTQDRPEYLWASKIPYRKRITTAPVRLALAEMYTRDSERAESFTKKLITGVGLQEGDPELVLRNSLINGELKNNVGGTYRKSVYACKAALDGRKIRSVRKKNISW